MPSFFIMVFKVVLGIPRRWVAALITPPVAEHPEDMIALHLLEREAAVGNRRVGPQLRQRRA